MMSSINSIGSPPPASSINAAPGLSDPSAPVAGGGGLAPASNPAGKCCAGANAATDGASALQGGGGSAVNGAQSPMEKLLAAVEGLNAAVKQLAEVVSRMNGGQVAGMQGGAATAGQFVKKLDAPVLSGGSEDDAIEEEVLRLINKERAAYGLAPVIYNPVLDSSAEKHAAHMARVQKMAHDGIGDGTPGDRIRAEGFNDSWGENVATGQTSAAQVVAEWMASPTHRRNILDPNFRQMGVAFEMGADGRSYWAQSFGA